MSCSWWETKLLPRTSPRLPNQRGLRFTACCSIPHFGSSSLLGKAESPSSSWAPRWVPFDPQILNSCIIPWLHNYWEKMAWWRQYINHSFLSEKCKTTAGKLSTDVLVASLKATVFCSDSCLAWFIVRPLEELYSNILRLFALKHITIPIFLSPRHQYPLNLTALSIISKKTMQKRKSIHTVPSMHQPGRM